jgi:hypothetical protein
VTLGGNEMENDKYEWMSLEVNSKLQKELGKESWEGLKVAKRVE